MRISDWSSDVCSSDLQGFALDLERDQQEEHRHQAVVYPQQQGLVDPEFADAHFNRHLAERFVQIVQRRVGANQRDQCGCDEQDAAGRLQPEKIGEELRRVGAEFSKLHPHQPMCTRNTSNATHAANAASRIPPSALLTRRSPRSIGYSISANTSAAHSPKRNNDAGPGTSATTPKRTEDRRGRKDG